MFTGGENKMGGVVTYSLISVFFFASTFFITFSFSFFTLATVS